MYAYILNIYFKYKTPALALIFNSPHSSDNLSQICINFHLIFLSIGFPMPLIALAAGREIKSKGIRFNFALARLNSHASHKNGKRKQNRATAENIVDNLRCTEFVN